MRSSTELTPARGAVMSITASPSSTPTRRAPPVTWNWQSFILVSSDGVDAAGRGTEGRRPTPSHETKSAPEDLVARLLVEDLPLRATFGDRPRVASEDLSDLDVDRFLDARLVRERAQDLVPDVVRRLQGDHALLGQHLVREACRQVKQPLPAPPHHRTNPRSRASFSRVFVKSCR